MKYIKAISDLLGFIFFICLVFTPFAYEAETNQWMGNNCTNRSICVSDMGLHVG